MHSIFMLIFFNTLFQVKKIKINNTLFYTHTHTQIDKVALSSSIFGVVSFPPKLKLNNFFIYIL